MHIDVWVDDVIYIDVWIYVMHIDVWVDVMHIDVWVA